MAQADRIISLGRERTLHVVEQGDGPCLVLIHGALTTHVDWPQQLRRGYAARTKVVAVDRPGHGDSIRPRFAGAATQQARQIRDGLSAAGVGEALLVGHSFGAMVALAHASLFPEQTLGLVLVAPICFPEWRLVEHTILAPRAAPVSGPFVSQAAAMLDPVFLRAVHRLMFAPQPVPQTWTDAYPFEKVLSREHMVCEGEDAASIAPVSPDAWLSVAAIRAPTRIVLGDADQVADPYRHGIPLAQLMPHASLEVLPGVGHMAHHCACAEVHEAIVEMLSAVN